MVDLVGYCLKCKKKTKMHSVKEVTMKNGRKAAKGQCSCGTNMFKILGGPSSASKSKKSKSTKSKKSKKDGKSRSKKSKKATKSKRKTKSRRKSKKA
jgi:hypothetical protein